MPQTRDIVILGAGHNGLVTAFYLAKAGFKPLILERRPMVGGCAITEEFHPGFRCSRLSHSDGPIRPDIVRDMDLAKHGLKAYTPDVRVLSLSVDGKPLVLHGDVGKSQQEIAKFSQKDAAAYVEFQKPLARIGEVANLLMTMTPPDLEDPAAGNLWELVKAGRKLRGLGEKDLYRMMRWGPMAVADLVAEWFETEFVTRDDSRGRNIRDISRPVVRGFECNVAIALRVGRKPGRAFIPRCGRARGADCCHGGGGDRGWG